MLHGHDVGDILLRQYADRLKSSVREDDVLCRVGGDEFLVLLNGIKEEKQINHLVKRIHTAFREPYEINGSRLNVTSSIGIAVFPKDGLESKSLISHADQALYRAKEQRDYYLFYS
nr:GGDEF domain-containing protein [Oceanobacillus bengalensis]